MNGWNMSTAFHVACAGFKRAKRDTELNRIMWNLLEMNSQIGLKSLCAQSIIEGRAVYTVSPEEGFIPVSIWTTYPWWRRLLNSLRNVISNKGRIKCP